MLHFKECAYFFDWLIITSDICLKYNLRQFKNYLHCLWIKLNFTLNSKFINMYIKCSIKIMVDSIVKKG